MYYTIGSKTCPYLALPDLAYPILTLPDLTYPFLTCDNQKWPSALGISTVCMYSDCT